MGGLISAKFLVVLAIALIVLGPEKLPDAARTMGRWLTEFRRITTGLTQEVREALDASELAEPIHELRSTAQTFRSGTTGWVSGAGSWLTTTPAQAAGAVTPGAAVAPVAPTPGSGPMQLLPEGELGVPPGDPSLN